MGSYFPEQGLNSCLLHWNADSYAMEYIPWTAREGPVPAFTLCPLTLLMDAGGCSYMRLQHQQTLCLLAIMFSACFWCLIFISLFLAALGLHCCMQAFSSCNERGLLSSHVRAFHCSGFSCLQSMDSIECGLNSCLTWVQLPHGTWNLPGP